MCVWGWGGGEGGEGRGIGLSPWSLYTKLLVCMSMSEMVIDIDILFQLIWQRHSINPFIDISHHKRTLTNSVNPDFMQTV